MTLVFSISGVPRVLPYRSTLESLGLGDVRRLGAAVAATEAYWPIGVSRFHLDGRSVCPIEVRSWSTGRFQVFLEPGAGADDCELGARLLVAVGRFANEPIAPKGESALSADAFAQRYDRAWAVAHADGALRALLAARVESGERQTLNGVCGPLALGPRLLASLQKESDPVAALMERVRRFNYLEREDVHEGRLLVLSESGPKPARVVRVVAYGGVPTLLSARADFVWLLDGTRFLHVRLERLAELLGDAGVWLSEDAFLAPRVPGHAVLNRDGTVIEPVAPDGRWAELLCAARAHDVADIFADAEVATTTGLRERMMPAEWAQLVQAPFMIFVLVAGQRGAKLPASQAWLRDSLIAARHCDCPVLTLVAIDLLRCFESTLATELDRDGRELTRRIARVTNLIETRLAPADARSFKRSLLALAIGVPVERPSLLARLLGAEHYETAARNTVATLLRVRDLA